MKLAYLRQQLNEKFVKLKFLQKIELFLLPFFLLVLFVFLHENIKKEQSIKVSKEIIKPKLSLQIIDKNLFTSSFTNFCKSNNITIISLNKLQKKVRLQIFTNMKKIIKSLNFIENLSSNSFIEELNIKNKEEFFTVTILVDLSKNYRFKKRVLKDNSFNFLVEKKVKELEKIEAVIFDYEYKQNKWHKKEEDEGY